MVPGKDEGVGGGGKYGKGGEQVPVLPSGESSIHSWSSVNFFSATALELAQLTLVVIFVESICHAQAFECENVLFAASGICWGARVLLHVHVDCLAGRGSGKIEEGVLVTEERKGRRTRAIAAIVRVVNGVGETGICCSVGD